MNREAAGEAMRELVDAAREDPHHVALVPADLAAFIAAEVHRFEPGLVPHWLPFDVRYTQAIITEELWADPFGPAVVLGMFCEDLALNVGAAPRVRPVVLENRADPDPIYQTTHRVLTLYTEADWTAPDTRRTR